jgi:hypothetical protein
VCVASDELLHVAPPRGAPTSYRDHEALAALSSDHPKLGAAERRAALLVNVLTQRELQEFRRSPLTFGALG